MLAVANIAAEDAGAILPPNLIAGASSSGLRGAGSVLHAACCAG
jgi:hypothetical protein